MVSGKYGELRLAVSLLLVVTCITVSYWNGRDLWSSKSINCWLNLLIMVNIFTIVCCTV